VIQLIKVKDREAGNLRAHDILKEILDSQTLLALSGGTSPDYRKMVVEPNDLLPGVVCLVDERYGEPLHRDSNELLLENAGLVEYLNYWGIEFYKILKGKGFEETAKDYDQTIAELFKEFPKIVGVMGIGANLHTAGIFPNSKAVKSEGLMVFETVEDRYPQRITLTLKALGQFQTFIILVFGGEKREALKILLSERQNDMQKYPAIFYRKCSAKCWLITDIEL